MAKKQRHLAFRQEEPQGLHRDLHPHRPGVHPDGHHDEQRSGVGADGYVQQPHGHSQRHRPVRPDQNGSRQRGKQARTVNESDLYCAYLLSKNVIKKEPGHS